MVIYAILRYKIHSADAHHKEKRAISCTILPSIGTGNYNEKTPSSIRTFLFITTDLGIGSGRAGKPCPIILPLNA